MTHRGDSDWHGYPLGEIVDQVAQQVYDKLRTTWPPEAGAPETLAEFGRTNPERNLMMRQIKEAALASVTPVLDIVNSMPHPIVAELQGAFAELQAAYDRREHGGVAQDKCLRKIQHEILPRYTQEDA